MSFQDPHSILMRYRLVGYDRGWLDMEDVTRRTVNYTNLPPGDYAFEVMAANNAGVWNPVAARYAFAIRPWFHETAWFYALLALLVALLVYGSYLYQRWQHAAQRVRLESQVAERTRELRHEIAERERAEDQLRHQVLHDGLTGLPNRGYLRDRLQRALAMLKRDPDRCCALLFMDLDRFKIINDSLGHLVGDEVLKEVSRRLLTCVRGPDIVARLSGDEFAILLEDVPIPATAAKVAQRVLKALAVPARIGGTELALATSIGIAFGDPRHETADEVLRDADTAMYRAKKQGRGRYESVRRIAAATGRRRAAPGRRTAHGAAAGPVRTLVPAHRAFRHRCGRRLRGADPLEPPEPRRARARPVPKGRRGKREHRGNRLAPVRTCLWRPRARAIGRRVRGDQCLAPPLPARTVRRKAARPA